MQTTRRGFFAASGAAMLAAAPAPSTRPPKIDFRYSPVSWQTAFCFPDDHSKSLIGDRGELRCHHPGNGGIIDFREIVTISLNGMERDVVREQHLEAAGVPILHTRIERPEAWLDLTTFATNRKDEGRVDNVLIEVRPRGNRPVHAEAIVVISSRDDFEPGSQRLFRKNGDQRSIFLATDTAFARRAGSPIETILRLQCGVAAPRRPLRYFVRLPQQDQSFETIEAGLHTPDALLEEVRAYWKTLQPFGGELQWTAPGAYGDFLSSCARNILQAREVRNGHLTYQVGPTVYRGLWVVDGNFLLEAARYLGHDETAQQGLETTWARQRDDGGIFASAGTDHLMDTAIPLLTLVRQAELAQDWTYFRKKVPDTLRVVRFLIQQRERARKEGGANGRYGLLPRGMGDGGLGGIRPEFANTVWTLAGLKALSGAGQRLGIAELAPAADLYGDLRRCFDNAAREEMRTHAGGFRYLPMLMKEDPAWNLPDPWDRPKPQVGQWALSQAIFPGCVFSKDDAIVRGHIALMKTCTQEDIPAETGWITNEGVWNYNAAFVAEVYLWAGVADWARRTFNGFLNHAAPTLCWREEQPLHGSLVNRVVGDMPHNWASAECIRYLRHMLALEDGEDLRLLAGVGASELAWRRPYTLKHSPTRFGRVSVALDGDSKEWVLQFERGQGPAPRSVMLPASLGGARFQKADGAEVKQTATQILLDPAARSWTARWRT